MRLLMKLLALSQTSDNPADIVFRNKRLSPAMATIIFALLLAGDIYGVAQVQGAGLRVLLIFWGLFLLLFVWLAQRAWRAALHPTNWLMRICGTTVQVKFRSFQNWRLSGDDLQIIQLDCQEIAFVRRVVDRQISRDSEKRTQARTQIVLQMGLQNVDTTVIQAALQEERSRRVKQGTTDLDYPVELDNDLLGIRWNSITPGLKQALAELGKLAPVKAEAKTINDFTPTALKTLGEAEQRKRIKELAARDPLAAIRTARELYGCSLAEAKQIVES